jgi:hypothetical protein
MILEQAVNKRVLGKPQFSILTPRSLAVLAIVVEATNEKAAGFCRDFGFAPFPSRPLRPLIAVPSGTMLCA